MGTHIISVAEVKLEDAWYRFTEIDVLDDYRLFAKMAGIRGDQLEIKPIVEPRGLPNDCSLLTKKRFDSRDNYGHSFLSVAELAEAESFILQFYKLDGEVYRDRQFRNRFFDRLDGPFCGFGIFYSANYILKTGTAWISEGLEVSKDDIRLVFCFT